MKHWKLLAKVLLADKARAVLGSINLTTSSFDERRELAIHVKDPDVVSGLAKVLHDDWRNSYALDLSDRAVLSDLARHPKNGGLEKLATLAANQGGVLYGTRAGMSASPAALRICPLRVGTDRSRHVRQNG